MKRIISVLLASLLIFTLIIPASALPKIVGIDILRLEFDHGEGPYDENDMNVDYSYYSPVKKGVDTKLYPLVVICPGALEGQSEGEELYENNFALWACDEFQKEFAFSDGAFILIARAQEDKSLFYNWSSDVLTEPLHLAIDDFCENHPNVDRERIYGIGWCQGAKAMINSETDYPGFMKAVVLAVPNFLITEENAKALSNSNVWFMGSKNDSLGLYNQYIKPGWANLKAFAAKDSLRYYTLYSKAKNTGLAIQHDVWDDMSYNWNYIPKSTYAKVTTDADGNTITVSSFIAELSKIGTEGYSENTFTPPDSLFRLICDGEAHEYSTFRLLFIRLYNRFISILASFFGVEASYDCDCGAH